MTILFICPYPIGQSPSQRFRFEQYFDLLRSKGYFFDIHPFLSLSTWKILYTPGHSLRKIYAVLSGFVKRFLLLPSLRKYNFVFIHREATPVGPPWFEWVVAKVFKKKIIYDFDDAIWLPNVTQENNLVSNLKWYSKVKSICKWSYTVSCGNDFLCDFARKFNDHVVLNPTTIDTEKLHNTARYPEKIKSDEIIVGWTGTHSTLKYIDIIIPIIQSLENKFFDRLKFIVIADKNPSLELASFCFIPWAKETEIEDLLQFDIGLMPLTDDIWARGKCGFKALQYMALGIPTIASAVGVNKLIIEEGVDGFLCESPIQWEEKIIKLIEDSTLRTQMGKAGRAKIVNNYSVDSNSKGFLSLFE
ncbi:MAG: glycosyltransferase [Cyclobacteriaceae bacterium]|nr:glycosyltransferase [Cyclobacteriaceae bacterium]